MCSWSKLVIYLQANVFDFIYSPFFLMVMEFEDKDRSLPCSVNYSKR